MTNSSFSQTFASLQFLNGPLLGQTFPVSKQDISVGSADGNDIVINHSSIQPFHARIYREQGQFVIRAYNQQCIVMSDDNVVAGSMLSDGSEISLGQGITFRWTTSSTQNGATPKSIPVPSRQFTAPQRILRSATPASVPVPVPTQQLTAPQQAFATSPQTPALPPQSSATPPQNLAASALETTRYLCAAAHLDEDFREYAMKNVFEEEHRAVGESYGVDIFAVAKWCYAARQRVFYRDLCLVTVLLALVFSDIYFISLIFSSILHPATSPQYPYSSPQDASPLASLQSLSFVLAIVSVPILLFLSTLPLLIIALLFRSTRRVIAQIYGLLLLSLIFPLLIPCFLVAWLILIVEQIISHGTSTVQLAKGRFRPDSNSWSLNPKVVDNISKAFQTRSSNVVVYSGYSPFAGSGNNISGWSFAIDISKRKEGLLGTQSGAVKPFGVSELYTDITNAIAQLGLGNVSLEDKLYVNGQSIKNDVNFLPDRFSRPYSWVDPAFVKMFEEQPLEHIRYYKCIRVTSWDGEMVLSIFVRFRLAGKNLFVEADYELLPPVKGRYHEIDTIEPTLTASKFFKFARRTFSSTPLLWLSSIVRVVKYVLHEQILASRRANTNKSISENPAFDYGTSTSLREVASSRYYQLYFQRLDKEMYVKIIERQLLDTIVHFLDARNIDTTDLKARESTILNNAVIVAGGTFTAGNLAVGEKANATSVPFNATPISGVVQAQAQPNPQS